MRAWLGGAFISGIMLLRDLNVVIQDCYPYTGQNKDYPQFCKGQLCLPLYILCFRISQMRYYEPPSGGLEVLGIKVHSSVSAFKRKVSQFISRLNSEAICAPSPLKENVLQVTMANFF